MVNNNAEWWFIMVISQYIYIYVVNSSGYIIMAIDYCWWISFTAQCSPALLIPGKPYWWTMINDCEKFRKTLSFERIQHTAGNQNECGLHSSIAISSSFCFCFVPTPLLPKPAWVKPFSDQSTCDVACAFILSKAMFRFKYFAAGFLLTLELTAAVRPAHTDLEKAAHTSEHLKLHEKDHEDLGCER